MSCSHLTGNYMLSCTARREAYVPSGFEFDEYCMSSRYKLCPFYDQDRPHGAGGRTGPPVAAAARTVSDSGAATDTDRFTRETRTRYGRDPF